MKVLILGIGGQVGSELRSAVSSQVLAYDNNAEIIGTTRQDLDLTKINKISPFIEAISPDVVINSAAYTAVDKAESETELAYGVNGLAVREIALGCARIKSKLIHISTDYLFNGKASRPYSEGDIESPLGVYGKSKFAGEEAIRDILAEHIILRTSWVFGVSGPNFVKSMLKVSELKDDVGVVADQVGAPTSARAIAKAIAKIVVIMERAEAHDVRWGTYHFSGQPHCSWFEFANEIFEQAAMIGLISNLPKVRPISTLEYPTLAARPANSRLDCSKLQNTFQVGPDNWKLSLGEMLHELKQETLN